MSVKFTIRGDKAVKKSLTEMGERARSVEKAWPSVGSYLSNQVNQQFVTEGRRFGTPWRPLKPEYKLWKMRHGFSRKILRQTGKLKESFTGRPMDIEEYRGNSATFGSSLDSAVWHQKGTRRNGKRVNPPRPMLVATKEVRLEVKRILLRYITRGRIT
jgi:phage gpG-like protein